MLFLGVVALVMPAVFDLSLFGRLDVESPALERLSFLSAIVLIAAYAGSLIYAFTAQTRSVPADARGRARESCCRPRLPWACSPPARC